MDLYRTSCRASSVFSTYRMIILGTFGLTFFKKTSSFWLRYECQGQLFLMYSIYLSVFLVFVCKLFSIFSSNSCEALSQHKVNPNTIKQYAPPLFNASSMFDGIDGIFHGLGFYIAHDLVMLLGCYWCSLGHCNRHVLVG